MTQHAAASIVSLYRYPVKGFSPESLDTVSVETGQCFPWDRTYAVENGGREFDPVAPEHMPKIKFLNLMRHERLAALETQFDATTCTLTILREGRQVATGRLDQKIGRQIIEQFLAAYMPDDIRGAPRIVSADGHHFTDVAPTWLSVINLASVRELERVMKTPVDPLRFRGNIYIDGVAPWSEFDWLEQELAVDGEPVLEVRERIQRCAATNVDPSNGKRDLTIPRALSDAFGHMDMGIYVSVARPATFKPGNTIGA